MAEFKVGDRVQVLSGPQAGDKWTVTDVMDNYVYFTTVNGTSDYYRKDNFRLVSKTLDTLAVDDVIVDDHGCEFTVIGLIGKAVFLADEDGHAIGDYYTIKELKDNDWTVKQPEPEVTELTLAQIAEKFGKDVSSIRVKK